MFQINGPIIEMLYLNWNGFIFGMIKLLLVKSAEYLIWEAKHYVKKVSEIGYISGPYFIGFGVNLRIKR